MDIRPLYLFSFFVAIACLIAELVRLGVAMYRWAQNAGLRRLLSRQKPSRRKLGQYLPWNEILLFMAGGVFGWSITSQIETWFVREWLLLTLTGLVILSNELRLSARDVSLLAVMALIAGISEQRGVGTDVFEKLARVVDGLPPGDVQKGAREVLVCRRNGMTVEQSFQPLSGIHPILNELIFTLHLTGGQALPAFDVALERLSLRASRRWDRASRTMIFRKQIQPLLLFGQAAILMGLLYLVLGDITAFTLAWPSYAVLGWVALCCFSGAGVLYAAYHRIWLRRILGVALLTASLIFLWQNASLPRLFELQLQPITYFKEGASGKRTVEIRKEWAPIDPPIFSAAPEDQLENVATFIQPIAMPALSNRAEEQTQSLSIPFQSQDEKTWTLPCCQAR